MRDSLPTTAILSRWLRRSGTLPCGEITDVRIELEFKTTISKLIFFTATYSTYAPANLPRCMVIKSPLTRIDSESVSDAELQFYRLLAPILGTPPLVRCLAAIDDEHEDHGALVLEDLRGTHDHPPWPIPPSKNQCEISIDALARVHAQWWEAPTLGKTIGRSHTRQSLTSMVQGIAGHLPAFIDALGDALTSEGRRVYERGIQFVAETMDAFDRSAGAHDHSWRRSHVELSVPSLWLRPRLFD